jgi:Glycosyltransferase like family 2
VIYAHTVSTDLAPVVLFAYRRPDHLDRTLRALAANPLANSTHLTIYCDGPRDAQDLEAVEATRSVAKNARGFAGVDVIERTENLGLAQSVITGVTESLKAHESVIVMEDDLVVSPDFLDYMNQALALYQDDDRVISIHGYMYAVPPVLPQTVFLRGADCWGWATWRRGWKLFESDSHKLLQQLDASPDRADFDFNGAFPYRRMLKDQAKGRIDSWAVRWYASAFLADKLTLYPGQSLVENIGQEGSGTHSEAAASHDVPAQRIGLPLTTIEVRESVAARDTVSQTLLSARGDSKSPVKGIVSSIKRQITREKNR